MLGVRRTGQAREGPTLAIEPFEIFAIRYAHLGNRHPGENFLQADPHEFASDLDYFVWVLRRSDCTFVVDTGFGKEAAARRAAEKAEEEARRAAEEQHERRVQSLIEHGKSRAFFATTRWESEDREEARADVEHALEDEVESDWSDQDVEELVDDLLEEWEEEDA